MQQKQQEAQDWGQVLLTEHSNQMLNIVREAWEICLGKIGKNNIVSTVMGTTDGQEVEKGFWWEEELKWFSEFNVQESAPLEGAQELPSHENQNTDVLSALLHTSPSSTLSYTKSL